MCNTERHTERQRETDTGERASEGDRDRETETETETERQRDAQAGGVDHIRAAAAGVAARLPIPERRLLTAAERYQVDVGVLVAALFPRHRVEHETAHRQPLQENAD